MNKDTTGARIKAVRKSLGMSQKNFARTINILPPTLCAYEKDRTSPALNALIKIAEIGNVTMDWLCGLSEEPSVKAYEEQYLIYKIYYDQELVYIGKTAMPLEKILFGHVAKEPTMCQLDPRKVSKIESAEVKTQADLFLYWTYLVNLFKPLLNEELKSNQLLTVELPQINFQEQSCDLVTKWQKMAERLQQAEKDYRINITKLRQLKRRKKKEITSDKKLSEDDKLLAMEEWEINIYEPELRKIEEALRFAMLQN